MGSMTRQMRRQARRRVGELTDNALDMLAFLRERAVSTGDDQARADCHMAIRTLEHSLTPDGYATDTTVDALKEVLAGPIARAMARLCPDLPPPPGGEQEHAAALLR